MPSTYSSRLIGAGNGCLDATPLSEASRAALRRNDSLGGIKPSVNSLKLAPLSTEQQEQRPYNSASTRQLMTAAGRQRPGLGHAALAVAMLVLAVAPAAVDAQV